MVDLINKLLKFRRDRNWEQFHSPASLPKSLVIESAELLEHFQFLENDFNIDEVKL